MRRRTWLARVACGLLFLYVGTGVALADAGPPLLSVDLLGVRPGTLVTLGPQSEEPRGVPLLADCASPKALMLPASALPPDGEPDLRGAVDLGHAFSADRHGWLTLRFRVPRVAAGDYHVVILCGGQIAAGTYIADGGPLTVTSGGPATDTAQVGQGGSSDWIGVVLAVAVCLLGAFAFVRRVGPSGAAPA